MSTWLTRKQAADYLKARIATGSVSLLSKLARTGDGPRCYTTGKVALYRPDDLDDWIASRLRLKGTSAAPTAGSDRAVVPDQVQAAFNVLRDLGIGA